MGKLGSIRELARILNVSDSSVRMAIKEGRIHVVRREAGKTGAVLLDLDVAAKEWTETRDPRRPTKNEMTGAPETKSSSTTHGNNKNQYEFDSMSADSRIKTADTFQKARAAKEAYNAKLKGLEYELQSKSMVKIDQVRNMFYEIAKAVQQNMLNIPARVAPMLAAETDEKKIYDLLESEISRALEVQANGNISI